MRDGIKKTLIKAMKIERLFIKLLAVIFNLSSIDLYWGLGRDSFAILLDLVSKKAVSFPPKERYALKSNRL